MRSVPLPNATVRERLEAFDAADYAFTYRVLDPSPLQMSDYVADVRLRPEGPQACRIEWSGRFAMPAGADPATQKAHLEAFYRSSIEGLRQVLAEAAGVG